MKKTILFIFLGLFAVTSLTNVGCASTSHKRSAGEVFDDSVITNKVKFKFAKDKTVKALQVHVKTRKGVVHLHGEVGSQKQIDRAIELAEETGGVKGVKSYLVIKEGSKKKKKSKVLEEEDIEK